MSFVTMPAGRYVVAVSGGIDSIVLLDMLRQQSGVEVIVAHVDHGIRPESESAGDAAWVARLAGLWDLPLESRRLQLGPKTSEAAARTARYQFLRECCRRHQAYLVTAHHQDDVLETICINLIRGTGWRGLAVMNGVRVLRPLLGWSKADIVQYALTHRLAWCHDATNDSLRYLRNRVRTQIIPSLSPLQRRRLIELWHQQCELADAIDHEAAEILPRLYRDHILSRYWLIMLPIEVASELVQAVCRQAIGRGLSRPDMWRMVHFARTARVGHRRQLSDGLSLRATQKEITVIAT